MTDYLQVKPSGAFTVSSGETTLIISASDARVPAEVAAAVSVVASDIQASGHVLIHMERSSGRAFTHRVSLSGSVHALEYLENPTAFDLLIGSVPTLVEATRPVIPTPEPPPARLSFPQLLFGLVSEAWITQEEADAWLVSRVLPASVTGMISTLPADQQILARARALQPTEVVISDPMVQSLGQSEGKTPEQMAEFFDTYSKV